MKKKLLGGYEYEDVKEEHKKKYSDFVYKPDVEGDTPDCDKFDMPFREYKEENFGCKYYETGYWDSDENEEGEPYVLLPGKNGMTADFNWVALPETIERLRKDGFDIDKVWDPFEYWSVEWGY